MKPKACFTNWTEKRLAELASMVRQDISNTDIAAHFGITVDACRSQISKARKLGIDIPYRPGGHANGGRRPKTETPSQETLARNQRRCLCCGNPFKSAGPHNRLCGRCKGQDVSPYAIY